MPLPILAFLAPPAAPPEPLAHAERAQTWEAFDAAARRCAHGAYVAEAAAAPDLPGWLRAHGCRAPVLAVAPEADADALLRAGAAEVLPPDADAAAWARALRRLEARAEAAERKAWDEERYRLMVEHTLDIVSVIDGLGRFTYVSPSIRDKFLWEPDELLGKSVFELIHADDRERVAETFFEAVTQPGATREVEYRLYAKGGGVRHVEGVGRALIGPDGEPYGVVNARDITERKEAELALRRSEARYRSLLDAIPDAIMRIGPDGRVEDFHAPSAFQTVYAVESLKGRVLAEQLEPAIAAQFSAAIAHVQGGGTPATFRYRIAGAGGDLHREACCVAYGDEVLAVLRDTTEQVQAEATLREHEALLREVIARVPVLLFALTGDGRISLAEGWGLEMLGLSGAELRGRSALELLAPLPAVRRVAERALQGETLSEVVELKGRAFDSWLMALRGGDGEVSGVIGVAVDVTDMRRQQAELERSRAELRELAAHLQNVREAERARLSREVHDVLGQALTVIRLGVGWLGRRLADDAEAQERVEDTQACIDETVRHVRQIAADLRPGVLDDLGLVSALEWQAEEFARRSGVPCAFSCEGPEPDLPPPVATSVFRIFQEALTNVARHAAASRVTSTLRRDPDALRLTISDDGVGIAPERLAQGRTLGLLGMRERARIFGGGVHVSGSPGAGTSVEVEIPLDAALPAAPPPPEAVAAE